MNASVPRFSRKNSTGRAGKSLASPSLSRRDFLRTAALAGLAAPLLISCETTPPAPSRRARFSSDKLRHACIGVGGMGANDLQNFLQHKSVEVVALCDVDANHLESAAKTAPGARLYRDWRELLAKEHSNIDSVNVSVPDHMHFAIGYNAIRNGKHVYCQKPMCHDVAEVRVLTRAARTYGVVTQLGTQGAASVHERTAVRWLHEGLIGKITRAFLCSNRPGAVEQYRLTGPRPATGQQPPPQLEWDLWLGTAPTRPYAPEIYHPVKWRAWQDFGTGWSGDIGCHIFDPVWKGLGLTSPLTVTAEVQESWEDSPPRRADTWPQGDHITWTFPANQKIAGTELVVEWFDGSYYPPEHIRKLYSANLSEYPSESSILIGTAGALLIPYGYPPQLLPEEKFPKVQRLTLPPRNHYHQFVDACLGKATADSDFSISGPMSETVLLGTVAIRLPGKKLRWDPSTLRFDNHTEANALLSRTYREGWHAGRF